MNKCVKGTRQSYSDVSIFCSKQKNENVKIHPYTLLSIYQFFFKNRELPPLALKRGNEQLRKWQIEIDSPFIHLSILLTFDKERKVEKTEEWARQAIFSFFRFWRKNKKTDWPKGTRIAYE